LEGKQPPGFPIWVDSWVARKDFVVPIGTPLWKANFLKKNSELYSAHQEEFDKWVSKWQVLSDKFPASRRKLEWQAQDTESLWETIMHFRPSGIRAKKPTYVPALVAITQTSILGPLKRRLSPREGARLQGLPDSFSFYGQKDSSTYKQLGNGVNVGVVWHVLKQHVQRDVDILSRDTHGKAIMEAILNAPTNPDEILEDQLTRK
jgi:DNA (cytosine-5)-methyltransferase 1